MKQILYLIFILESLPKHNTYGYTVKNILIIIIHVRISFGYFLVYFTLLFVNNIYRHRDNTYTVITLVRVIIGGRYVDA